LTPARLLDLDQYVGHQRLYINNKKTTTYKWSKYDRILFSGHNKQEILIVILAKYNFV
jgi:hypothetical protein